MTILDPITGNLVTIDTVEQTSPLRTPCRWEVVMKRSSARRARRWVIQELTRQLDQRSEPLLDRTRLVGGKPDPS